MNSLQHITFDTHSKVLEFFKDLNMPKELAVQFYAELEALLSAYVSRLVLNAHNQSEISKFKAYIDLKNITDELKIARMLTISFEKKTGKKVDDFINEFLNNFIESLNKATDVIQKHKKDTDETVDLEQIYKEVTN